VNSRDTKFEIRKLSRMRVWQLCLVFLLMVIISATFLRLNNVAMTQRRQAVLDADKSGTTNDIKQRLYDLQSYVLAHMNTSTGVFYLQNQYYQAADQAKESATQNSSNAVNLYKKVDDEICAPLAKANNWRWPDERYTNCLSEQLAKYPSSQVGSIKVNLPNPDMFRYNYSSPTWSPDLAGLSVLVTILILLLVIFRVLELIFLKVFLKIQHNHS